MRPEIRRENVSTEASDRSRFLLGSATVDPVDGTVTGPEHSVRLEPRVMEVLIAMSRRAGEVLSREELMNAVWGDTVVTNDVLARCVYQLRSELPRVLGAATADDVIETLRKRGYRLKVAVNPLDTGAIAADPPKKAWTALSALLLTAALAAAAWWWFDTEQSPPIRSIAVLPFVNMTGDPDLESLADGFTEQLSHALANVPQLRVSARTSAFAFKNKDAEIPVIAGRLGVESLLEGSVRRNGAQLRVTVQLIRDDGFHIWSREYDRPHRDILALQSEVSQAVLGELGLAPAAEQASELKKTNYVAYDLYLRGRLEMKAGGEDKFPRAIALFERAINEDPEYPLAYSGLADAYSLQLWGVSAPDEAAWAKIDEAIDRALSLDDRLAEAHASRGLRLYMSKQYVEAESHLRHAVSLNPNYVAAWVWLGLDLVLQDRFSEASEVYQRAQLLDPLNPGLNRNLGANLLLAGRPDEGFTYLERATQIAPDHPQAYRMIAWWAVHYGRLPVALSWAQDGLERFGEDPVLLAVLGHTYAALGLWDEAGGAFEKAYHLIPHDDYVLERVLMFHLMEGDLSALDDKFQQRMKAETISVTTRRILLRWAMIRDLLAGAPDRVIAQATPDVEQNLRCNAFGAPGPRLYLAYALRLSGQEDEATSLLSECLDDVARIQAQGGTYPRTTYRMALTMALAGDLDSAAEHLQQAVDQGWRAYWDASTDPLWTPYRHQQPFTDILEGVRLDVEKMTAETAP